MKRQDFIRLMSLTGVVWTVLPFKLFSAKPHGRGLQKYMLQPTQHVRHGLLTQRKGLDWTWLQIVQNDIFYSNGFDSNNKDLRSLQFVLDGKTVQLNMIDNQVWYKDGSDEVSISTEYNSILHLGKGENWRITLFNSNVSEAQELQGTEHAVLPLKGVCRIKGESIRSNEIGFIKGNLNSDIELTENSNTLLISKI